MVGRATSRCGWEAIIGDVKRTGIGRPTAADWLLAEAVRHYETDDGDASPAAAATALDKARALDGPIEAKIVARAGMLPVAHHLGREISRLWSVLRGLGLGGIALAALAGAATARTAFAGTDGTTVNVFWLLASLLGLHGVSFLLWLALMLATPRRTSGGILGSALLWLWRQLSERIGAGPHRMAALRALAGRWGRGRAGRWLASTLSHGLWTGYLLGALAMALALLSAQQYLFVWETTILDADAYVRLTGALAALPAALGLAVPDRAAVLAAQWPGSPEAGHEGLWSSLLIASVLLYGLLPRVLALAASIVSARRGAAAAPDLGTPYYALLVTQLSPMVGVVKVIDSDGGDDGAPPSEALPELSSLPRAPAPGPVYLIGWEIDAPATGWPPAGTPSQVHDLGRRDSRVELDRAIGTLAQAGRRPARLVVVLDLRQTPDRGVSAVLSALRDATREQLIVLFTGGGTLNDRMPTADAATRIADWVSAGLSAGIDADQMIALDLDLPTDDDRRRLTQILQAAS